MKTSKYSKMFLATITSHDARKHLLLFYTIIYDLTFDYFIRTVVCITPRLPSIQKTNGMYNDVCVRTEFEQSRTVYKTTHSLELSEGRPFNGRTKKCIPYTYILL